MRVSVFGLGANTANRELLCRHYIKGRRQYAFTATIMLQPGQRICRCPECSLHTITSGTGDIEGQVVSNRTYGLHRKLRYAIVGPAYPLASLTLHSGPVRDPSVQKVASSGPPAASQPSLGSLAMELKGRSRQLVLAVGLGFETPPSIDALIPELPIMDTNDLRLRTLALTPNDPVNKPVSEYERWLFMAKDQLQSGAGEADTPSDHLLEDLEKEFRSLQHHKIDDWRRQQETMRIRRRLESFSGSIMRPAVCVSVETGTCPGYFPLPGYLYLLPADFFGSGPLSTERLTLTCYVLMAALHLMCGLSLDDCIFFLPCIELIIRASLGYAGRVEFHLKLPRDPRTVLETLKLKPGVQPFVCCPKCFALYPPETRFSAHCSFVETPSSKPCDEPLAQSRRVGATIRSAFIREYFHQPLKTWLGRLLCRSGMEEILDRDVFVEGLGGLQTDIFSGDALRQFLGHDGSLFLPSRNLEGRYAFGLSVDAFNPFLNKQAGKKASVTAIYMVLLNLPPSSRYKVENMYLAGIIPGPKEPSLTQINHLLRPLVNELLELWNPGVWYVRTPRCVSGKLVKAALVPLICDLKAARQVMGHGSHSARKFCSICSLPWKQRNDINASSRIPVSAETFRRYALEWREARSESEKGRLFKKHGIRWSILLELPYWDPPRFTVIDSMHTILLGHLHRHCTIIWGLNPLRAGGDDNHKASKPPGFRTVVSTAWTIRSGSVAEVESLRTSLLRDFCLEHGLASHDFVMNSDPREVLTLVLNYVSALSLDPEKPPDKYIKRVKRGWFTHADQDKPKETLDFLARVECVPRSAVRQVAAHFRDGASADQTVGSIGNTRKVVLSALYADVLRRSNVPSARVEELVKSTQANSVSRLDIVTRVLNLDWVLRFHNLLPRADLRAGERGRRPRTLSLET